MQSGIGANKQQMRPAKPEICGVDGRAAADSDDFNDRDFGYRGEPAAQQDPAAIQATIPIWFEIHEYIGIDCSDDIFFL